MKKILKSGGYCSDGCQWFFCDYLRTEEHLTDKMVLGKNGEFEPVKRYSHHCDFFSGAEIIHGSLHICNQVYGTTYEGHP